MADCISKVPFKKLDGRQVVAAFDGGDMSSDGGVMLLSSIDDQLGLTDALASQIQDDRQQAKTKHSVEQMVAQRAYQMACGYEDCNDADVLRHDPMLKVAVGQLPEDDPLASPPTICRLENSIGPRELRRMGDVFVDLFVGGHRDTWPERIILDFDTTVDPTHGGQQLTLFHGYYGCYCYLPLVVTAQVDGGPYELLTVLLRPGNSHDSYKTLPVLKRLVARIRRQWPGVQILFRGDSGFATPRIYEWCETNNVDYLIGIAGNSRLKRIAEPYLELARMEHRRTGRKARHLCEDIYAAGTWDHYRRVLIKAEVTDKGDNPRFVVTNLRYGQAEDLYDLYTERGEMENRIKELKYAVNVDRTSCQSFCANQFRVLISMAAYVLLLYLRFLLPHTQFANAQMPTLQRDIIKLGARVKQTTRNVWLHFASSCPVAYLWPLLLRRIRSLG